MIDYKLRTKLVLFDDLILFQPKKTTALVQLFEKFPTPTPFFS